MAGAEAAPLAFGLEEIVVTARHRAEPLSDIGAAVSVLDADALARLRIRAPQDLQSAVANVEIGQPFGNAFSMFVIRGIGLNDYNTNNNPTVAAYADDVYLSSNAMIPRELFDLQRIEILKGPQGTLYGRNTTGGAVNLVSAEPGDTPEAYAEIGYGNYATLQARAAAGGPVTGRIGLRVAGYFKRAFDGPQYNRVTRRPHGEVRAGAVRATMTALAGESVSAKLTLAAGRDRSDVHYFQHRGVLGPACQVATRGIHDPRLCFDAFGYSDADGDRLAVDSNRRPRMQESDLAGTLRLQWRPGPWTLVSISNLARAVRLNAKDEDASARRVVQIDYDSRIVQASQELRLLAAAGRLDAMLGGFAGRYRHRELRRADIADFEAAFGPIFGTGQVELPYRQLTTAGAVFADLGWRVTPALKAEGGVRYSVERIAYRGGTRLPLLGVPLLQIDDRISTRRPSWRAGLSYDTGRALFYGQVSTSFKSGGFFGGFAFTPAELRPYRPETVTAYEAGVRWAVSAALSFDLAGFLYAYDDLQALAPGSIGAGGVVTTPTLRNLPGARVRGLDLEAAWQATAGLRLTGTLGLLHTRVRGPAFAFGSTGAAGPLFSLAGNQLPRAPRFTATLGADWRRPLSAALDLLAGATISWRARTHMDLLNSPMATEPGHALLNARLGLARGGWELSLWGRNLTNRMPYLAGGQAGFGERDLVVYGPPRTYGVELMARF